jgi:hypothetical protein
VVRLGVPVGLGEAVGLGAPVVPVGVGVGLAQCGLCGLGF